ncbi:hypothetical protein NE237_023530 [Protea cynaroides]|uniref:SB domain-containing protein n=1 Tax=Protea cynaroides TaxID=273540 RepID=A0A9Q0HBN5_9MAGN|nr:hypothetical protein NE237_023530 [Protea cynaroides]
MGGGEELEPRKTTTTTEPKLTPLSHHLRSIIIGLFLGSLLDLVLIGVIKYLVRQPRQVYNKGMHLTVSIDHWYFPRGHSSGGLLHRFLFVFLLGFHQRGIGSSIEPCDRISRQMVECSTVDLAIVDVIYSLDKVVQEGSVPFDQFWDGSKYWGKIIMDTNLTVN